MVAIERGRDSQLKGKALVVAPKNSDRAKVWSASTEAMQSGIYKGMELGIATRLERNLKVIHPNPDLYDSVEKKVLFKLSRYTPLYEREGPGKIYLDFSGFEKLYGDSLDFARLIKRELEADFKLPFRLGVSSNKLLAKAATDPFVIEENIYRVSRDASGSFLDPFHYNIIPNIKDFSQRKSSLSYDPIEDLNLERVANIKLLSKELLECIFLKDGESIYEMARGIDNRLVTPQKKSLSIFYDVHLKTDTNHYQEIFSQLCKLADKAFRELRRRSLACSSFKVALRYSDFKYTEKTIHFGYVVNYSYEILSDLERAFSFIFSRRTSIRYLSFELENLIKKIIQPDLFEDKRKRIDDLVDIIDNKYPQKISKGAVR